MILHLATYPEKSKGPVQEKTAQDVRRLVIDLILPHAFVFYRTAEAAARGDRLQRLASYILTSGKPRIVASDLTSNVADLRADRGSSHQTLIAIARGRLARSSGRSPGSAGQTGPGTCARRCSLRSSSGHEKRPPGKPLSGNSWGLREGVAAAKSDNPGVVFPDNPDTRANKTGFSFPLLSRGSALLSRARIRIIRKCPPPYLKNRV